MLVAVAWGTRLFGKVDRVPALGYVGTFFWHFCYVPLFPRGTMLVVGQDGTKYRGLNLPFSLKSMLVAWLRIVLVALIIPLSITALVVPTIKDRPVNMDVWAMMVTFGVVCAAVLIATYLIPGIGRATASREAELRQVVQRAMASSRAAGAYGRRA